MGPHTGKRKSWKNSALGMTSPISSSPKPAPSVPDTSMAQIFISRVETSPSTTPDESEAACSTLERDEPKSWTGIRPSRALIHRSAKDVEEPTESDSAHRAIVSKFPGLILVRSIKAGPEHPFCGRVQDDGHCSLNGSVKQRVDDRLSGNVCNQPLPWSKNIEDEGLAQPLHCPATMFAPHDRSFVATSRWHRWQLGVVTDPMLA